MNKFAKSHQGLVTLALLALPFAAVAQVPVDDDGKVVGAYEAAPEGIASDRATGNEGIPLLSAVELEELVGPIALYPDDLLAIVLPAAAYPMQLIEAERFLEDLENDPALEPDPDWDDSVVALLNYPEVVALLNEDIDWTWRLGEAVVAQQSDVVGAIESFRDRAYAAGNLRSDDYQTVSRNDGVIEIEPVSEDVIYVPYYEPERVVVYQPRPVYYYYPRAYPVYYYPYSSSYHFDRGYFWGVTTAFSIGWLSDSLHVYHHSYYGHPYYGRSYWNSWWYRRPSINIYNTTYVRNSRVTVNRYYDGDRWTPRLDRRRPARPTQPRVMNRDGYRRDRDAQVRHSRSVETRERIRFEERNSDGLRTTQRNRTQPADRNSRVRPADRNSSVPPAERSNRLQPAERRRVDARPTRESIARELRESRQRQPAARDRVERQEPGLRARDERREPATRQRTERRDNAVTRSDRQPRGDATERRTQRPTATRNRQPAAEVQSRRTPRAQPQRDVRRETRPQPQREVRREVRAQPQREVRREAPAQPQRQSRPEPRRESKPANSDAGAARETTRETRKRSKERRTVR